MAEREGIYTGSDTGGTMTDLFVVDKNGDFAVGKAPTTPKDLSIGYWESMKDAFSQWGIDLEKQAHEIFSNAVLSVYSGTTMLNALLTRSAGKSG